MAALYRASFAELVHHIAGGLAGGHDPFPVRRDYSPQWKCRSPLEAIQRIRFLLLVLRWPRDAFGSPRTEGRGTSHHLALGQAVHLHFAAAIHDPDLQR